MKPISKTLLASVTFPHQRAVEIFRVDYPAQNPRFLTVYGKHKVEFGDDYAAFEDYADCLRHAARVACLLD